MPRQFIGQDGFYPKWTSSNGRWVFQRVLTTAGTTMNQMETLLRPAESHEALLWAPKRKTILESLRPGDADIRRAIYELQHLPLICCRCDWQGKGPFIRFANYRPAHWRLRCPECESMVEPDVDSIDWDNAKQVLVERWIERSRPRLDPPGAAIALHSIAPISDLARWVDEYEPQENELIYVVQQLWPSFAECVGQLRAEDSIQVVKPWTKRAGQHFVLSTDDGEPRITCSDSTDGRAIWAFVGDQLGFWAPSARNNVVYLGSGDSMLTALDVFNGALLWKSACPEIVTTTPCVNAESVFVGCNGGVVRAFSSRNGELTWRYDPKTESEAVNQVFETDAGIVTITGDGQCRVFSSRTGDGVWDEILPWKDMSSSQDGDEYPKDQDDDEYSPEIPKIHHIGAVLVGSKETIWLTISKFWGRSLFTGKEGWSYRLPVKATAWYVSPPFLFYVTDESDEDNFQPRLVILRINEEDSTDPPEEVGRVELPKVFSPEEIIVHQQTLYGLDLGDVFSFDMVSSKLNWVKKLAVSRLLQADEDLLYLIDGPAKLVALNAENGDVVWTRAGVNDIALCNIQELRPEPSRGEEEAFTIDPLPGIKKEQDETGEACDRCGKPMVMKIGRIGNFLACTGFPDCRTTKPILNKIGVHCPRPYCTGEIVERRTRDGQTFFGCSSYPHDDFIINQRPVPTPCPRCGGMMVQQTQDVVSCTACSWSEEIR